VHRSYYTENQKTVIAGIERVSLDGQAAGARVRFRRKQQELDDAGAEEDRGRPCSHIGASPPWYEDP